MFDWKKKKQQVWETEKEEKDGGFMHVLNTMSERSFLERRIGMLDEKLGKVLRTRSDS